MFMMPTNMAEGPVASSRSFIDVLCVPAGFLLVKGKNLTCNHKRYERRIKIPSTARSPGCVPSV